MNVIYLRELGFPEKSIPIEVDVEHLEKFSEGFESSILFYDVFYRDGYVYFIGPARSETISVEELTEFYLDINAVEKLSFEISETENYFSMRCKLDKAPTCVFYKNVHIVPVLDRSKTPLLKKILFLINKNAQIEHLISWIVINKNLHGDFSLLFYDNGSDLYSLDHLKIRLKDTGVDIYYESVPYKFGALNELKIYKYNYLQYAAIKHAVCAYAGADCLFLQMDSDEVFLHYNIFEYAENSTSSALLFSGEWVYCEDFKIFNSSRLPRFSDHVIKSGSKTAPKYIVKLSRANFRTKYYNHSVGNLDGVTHLDLKYFHFRLITTNWKYNRFKNITEGYEDLERLSAEEIIKLSF